MATTVGLDGEREGRRICGRGGRSEGEGGGWVLNMVKAATSRLHRLKDYSNDDALEGREIRGRGGGGGGGGRERKVKGGSGGMEGEEDLNVDGRRGGSECGWKGRGGRREGGGEGGRGEGGREGEERGGRERGGREGRGGGEGRGREGSGEREGRGGREQWCSKV